MAITVPEPEARQAAWAAVGTLHRRYRRDAALEFARAGSLERVLQSTGRRTAGCLSMASWQLWHRPIRPRLNRSGGRPQYAVARKL